MTLSPSDEERRCIEAFVHVTRLERGLRGLIEDALLHVEGRNWWRSLPPDVRENAPKPDLAYTNFPDLKKILARSWTKIDAYTAGLTKQQVIVHLEELEAIRNDIAHSRTVSIRSLALVQGTYYLLEPVIVPYLSATSSGEGHDDAQIDLLELQKRVHNRESLGPELVDKLHASPTLPPSVVTVALEYGRLIDRPGRSPTLLSEAARRAIDEVEAVLDI